MLADGPALDWLSDDRLVVDGTEYHLFPTTERPFTSFCILKDREILERYLAILSEFHGGRIVELGIYKGGSTALFAQLLRPQRLVAVDLSPERVEVLDQFVADRDLDEHVRLHYGIDQAGGEELAALVGRELDGAPIDLVIDDASHLYRPSKTSFEALFPFVRPGGLFVIEDWQMHQGYLTVIVEALSDRLSPSGRAWEVGMANGLASTTNEGTSLFSHWFARAWADPAAPDHEMARRWYTALDADHGSPQREPIVTALAPLIAPGATVAAVPTLTTLASELVLAVGSGNPAFGEMTVNRDWISVRRGPGALVPGEFRLDATAPDRLGLLAATTKDPDAESVSEVPPPR